MYSVGVYMNPINGINFQKDSTISILKSLQSKAKVEYIVPDSVHSDSRSIYADVCDLKIISLSQKKYFLQRKRRINLNKLDCILFRIDPPVDSKYISQLQLFRELEYQNTLVLNSPESLLRFNEKILGCQLSQTKLPTIVTGDEDKIKKFLEQHDVIVLKPMNLMAGKGIIKVKKNNSSKELIREHVKKYKVIIAQKYIDEITRGDNRIIIYNGIIEKNVLRRMPPKGDFIANLANGGSFKITKVKKKYLINLEKVASFLKYHSIFFAGVDMIGDYITEINITSPTGVQNIKNGLSLKIANQLIKKIREYYN